MKSLMSIWLCLGCLAGNAQTIAGTWQVMKESNCLGDELDQPSDTEAELSASMATRSDRTPKVLQFNADNSGEQNWKSVGKKKSTSKEKFLYKSDGENLYLLDKKSRIIKDTFVIEILTKDSLVIFNKDRTCERLELVRIK